MGNLCFVDLETTSRNVFDAEIIEGHFIATNQELEIISEYEMKCNPRKWSHEAQAIHGITQDQAAKYRPFNEVYDGLINWLEAHQIDEMWCHSNAVMYGKLTFYDYAVLRLNMMNMGDAPYFVMNRIKPYSTHSLCKTHNGVYMFKGFSLDLICQTLKIELHHHNAKSDAYACYQIVKELLTPDSRDKIYNHERGVRNETRAVPDGIKDRRKSRKSEGHSFLIS